MQNHHLLLSWPLISLTLSCGNNSTTSVSAIDGGTGAESPTFDGGSDSGLGKGPDGSADSGSTFAIGTLCNDTGNARTPPAKLETVIVFMFENEGFSSVLGDSNAPYMNSIAKGCGYATHYADNCFTSNLASLPHYLAFTSGSNCNTGLGTTGSGCITDDDDATAHQLSTTSIFEQVSSWKAYQENMPIACDMTTNGNYACKHNPPPYYSQLTSGSKCSAYDVPIATVTCNPSTTMTACSPRPDNAFTQDLANDTLPVFAFVTPDLQNDMHDGTITQGDNWFYTYFPLVLQSKAYVRGGVAVFVLWDQGSAGQPTPNFFVSPYITAGTVSSTEMNHFASLRAAETALRITTFLGCASGTAPGGGTCPSGSTANLRSIFNF